MDNVIVEAGESDVRGKIQYISDVSGSGKMYYTQGKIAAISSEKWPLFKASLEAENSWQDGTTEAHLSFALTHTLANRVVAASTEMNKSGQYQLMLPAGKYYFCIGDLARPVEDANTYVMSVFGCTQQLIIQKGRVTVDFQYGELGVSGAVL
ncbi:hypothetical protein [Flocculibacter collagenilyticus]|uniref:hypothetical protein n=1 Tax=Flocculibacter collagenilyticus TaxID=2744479 RepID=UPI0018F5DD37|nr:hypothetical protein [Flocculibacter collagenilyticus]